MSQDVESGGDDVLPLLKGKIGIITNDVNEQMVELSLYKTISIEKSEIKIVFLEMLDSQLISNGFIKVKNNEWAEYLKITDFGFNTVTPVINQYSTLFFVSIAFAIRINEISEIMVLINNISDEYKKEYTTIGGGFQHLIPLNDSRIRIESFEELEYALKIFEGVLDNEAKLFFNKYKAV